MAQTTPSSLVRSSALLLSLCLALAGCSSASDTAPTEVQSDPALTGAPVQESVLVILDGDTKEWPTEQAITADEHYLYVRFAVENEQFTLQSAPQTVSLLVDLDGDSRTGKPGKPPVNNLGVDLEVQFSPRTGGPGVAAYAFTPGGKRTKIPTADLDFAFAPTYAASWYEARISRTPDKANGLPSAGLFSTGAVRAIVVTLDASAEIDGYSDLMEIEVGPACPGGKRLSSLDLPMKPQDAIRVMTYNIERSSPVNKPAQFSRIFQAINPDIILIQEWEEGDADSVRGWFTALVPTAEGWHVRKSEGTLAEGGGVAIVSRYPLAPILGDSLTVLDSDRGRDRAFPVRFVGAKVTTPLGEVIAASTHLKCCGSKGTAEDIRRMAEARSINANLSAVAGASPTAIRIVAGDLNLVGSRPPLDLLRAGLDVDRTDLSIADAYVLGNPSMYTWRDPGQPFSPGRLDYILYSDGCANVVNAFILDTTRMSEESLARMGLDSTDTNVSDHLPVIMDLHPNK